MPIRNSWKAIAQLCLPLPLVLISATAHAQIIPDGAGTTVTQSGSQFDIEGGTPVGTNLFHSFQQFGVGVGQTANFIPTGVVQNILGRVTGGASVIEGLMKVTGSNANLYLMNPAGIIFGSGASLDVRGSFIATTASGIGFGGGWFSATGTNNYANLTGNPTSFAFTAAPLGAIVNAANLLMDDGQSLALLGGTVINTGSLTTPGGNIIIYAVPGNSLLRLSIPGNLLSLEIPIALDATNRPNALPFNPQLLPALLTGSGMNLVTDLRVQVVDGQVSLVSNPTVPIQPGMVAIANSLNTSDVFTGAGSVLVDAVGNVFGTATIDATGVFQGGGTITFRSQDSIQFTGVLATSSAAGVAGAVNLTAQNNLVFGDIDSTNFNVGTGGDVTLTSRFGSVTGGKVWTSGENGGGNLTVNAAQSIQLGEIRTFATIGNGGKVKLDPIGDIGVQSIDTRGGTSGVGGSVAIATDRYFRATGLIAGTPFSILTSGGSGGGSITIQHGGGALGTPFTIGDATLNGTAGGISTGSTVLNVGQSLRESLTSGNIQITTTPRPLSQLASADLGNATSATLNSALTTIQLTQSTSYSAPSSLESDLPTSGFATEEAFTREYEQHLGITKPAPIKSIQDIRNQAIELDRASGRKTAFIYAKFEGDRLRLTLISAQAEFQVLSPGSKSAVMPVVKQFMQAVSNPNSLPQSYLSPSQRLHDWLIAPLSTRLQAEKIQNLIFVVDEGLRSLPFAALHDRQTFLVERYSLSMMPSFSLVSQQDMMLTVKNSILAMGASKFDQLAALPAVRWELDRVAQTFPNGQKFLNQSFTRQTLRDRLLSQPYGVVHLATHASVETGDISNSYIQLADGPLRLSELDTLPWKDQRVSLLVLSACNTALGDRQAELGFAGMAIKSGVRSTLASLWQVEDTATLVLMQQFYRYLKQAPLLAEALQRAQVAMLKRQAQFSRAQLSPLTDGVEMEDLPLLMESPAIEGPRSHPYYWAAFTLVGQPR